MPQRVVARFRCVAKGLLYDCGVGCRCSGRGDFWGLARKILRVLISEY